MEKKYYLNTDGRSSNIEQVYVSSEHGGFRVKVVGFEGEDFETEYWFRAEITHFLEHYNDPAEVTMDQDAGFFFWLIIELSDLVFLLTFDSNHPGWPYARILNHHIKGYEPKTFSTDGLLGW